MNVLILSLLTTALETGNEVPPVTAVAAVTTPGDSAETLVIVAAIVGVPFLLAGCIVTTRAALRGIRAGRRRMNAVPGEVDAPLLRRPASHTYLSPSAVVPVPDIESVVPRMTQNGDLSAGRFGFLANMNGGPAGRPAPIDTGPSCPGNAVRSL